VLKVNALTFTNTSSHLELHNNELLVVGSTSMTTVRAQLADGRLKTSFSGGQLGYVDRSGDLGAGSVEVRFTLGGDADLNGAVDVADLGALATAYGATSSSVWINGDFDYDAAVNVSDLGVLATNYGNSIPGYAGGGLGEAAAAATAAITNAAAVPEPASLLLCLVPLVASLSPRGPRRARVTCPNRFD
jgi:hypothetical protein